MKNLKINTHIYGQLMFDKEVKKTPGKNIPFTKWSWENRIIPCKKKKKKNGIGPLSYATQKLNQRPKQMTLFHKTHTGKHRGEAH